MQLKVDDILRFSKIIIKMWYLNYCSPFIYNTVGSSQTIRFILYSCLAVEFIVYIFYIIKYKWFGCMQSFK